MKPSDPQRIVGIVAATGGPDAIRIILGSLPQAFPAPIIFVMSMPPKFVDHFVAALNTHSRLPVVRAENGVVAEPGVVFVAPDSSDAPQLLVRQGRLQFVDRAPGLWNAMDSLFSSMARDLGPRAVAVILDGMGSDGARGAKEIRDAGGYTIAQDRWTSLVYGKPRFAVELGAVCESLPVAAISLRLVELVSDDSSNSSLHDF